MLDIMVHEENIEPFLYIETNTGFLDFFRDKFYHGKFPYYNEYQSIKLPSFFDRFSFIEEFGYYLPTMEVVDYLKKSNKKWLSVGCGRGYFEHILKLNGVDIIATDINSVDNNMYFRGGVNRKCGYGTIDIMDSITAINEYPDRGVIFSWVSYAEPWGTDTLNKMKSGRIVMNIGESFGGCTGDDDFNLFFIRRSSHIESLPHYTFQGIHDSVNVYKVK